MHRTSPPVCAAWTLLGFIPLFALPLAASATWVPIQSVRTDVGLRASVILFGDAEFGATHFLGIYVAPAVGSRRIKVGPRLQAGWVRARVSHL